MQKHPSPTQASKERLSQALQHLQRQVERIAQKSTSLQEENAALKAQLAALSEQYAALKEAGNTAFTQLNASIEQLETLMGDDTSCL